MQIRACILVKLADILRALKLDDEAFNDILLKEQDNKIIVVLNKTHKNCELEWDEHYRKWVVR